MQISPYLHFNGDCAEAFKFYAALLGGEVEMMMKFGESPMTGDVPDGWQDKVMHVQMKAPGGLALMGTDAPPAYFKTPQGFSVSLTVNEVNGAQFGVNIIPHTSKVTTFGRQKPGAKVNLEVDLMARYVARLVKA